MDGLEPTPSRKRVRKRVRHNSDENTPSPAKRHGLRKEKLNFDKENLLTEGISSERTQHVKPAKT